MAAFGVEGVDITVEGGAQDGVAKAMYGGKVAVMKGLNRLGRRVNGSVGKSFAYGAQRGRLFVQGDADSRFCIRLSGADVVVGGEPAAPLDDSLGCLADRANLKGFAFEYMTAGPRGGARRSRALVLRRPDRRARLPAREPRLEARPRRARAAPRRRRQGRAGRAGRRGSRDVQELLGAYAGELRATGQDREAERVLALAAAPAGHFLMAVPEREQMDPSVSTE